MIKPEIVDHCLKTLFIPVRINVLVVFPHFLKRISSEKEEIVRNQRDSFFDIFVVQNLFVVDGYKTFILHQIPRKVLDDRRFARAVEAHQSVNGAFRNREAEIVKRFVIPETLGDMLKFNHLPVSFRL